MAALIEVSDPDDPRLGDYRDLRDVQLRKHLGAANERFRAEGAQIVNRAGDGRCMPRSCWKASSRMTR